MTVSWKSMRLSRFESLTQSRKWCFQIVCDVGGNLAQAFHQFRYAVEHSVQRLRQSVKIVARAARGHALR